ncbi:MAG: ROK family protein [Tractidigestivibacter sp.]|uniref:ROK family protein n=1 Tax=Tractidigestivibacter sp. TaxID=2847320 RepID=UPI003D8A40AE
MARIGALEAGGTKMVLSVGTPDGRVLEREEIPTQGPDDCVDKMVDWFSSRNIDALGIGAFGPTDVNPKSKTYGQILETPKLAWRHFDFLDAFKSLNVPIGYDTDVNVACLGEVTYGAARGLDTVIYITVGTGVGIGAMIGGKLLHGMLHPEAGHVILQVRPGDEGNCVCPYHDACLEGLAAGPSIEHRWGAKGFELADKPEVWELESDYLAQGLTDFVLCYSPQKIIMGGGVMKQTQLFPLVRQKLLKYLNGYLVLPELQDIDHYVVEAGCKGDQGVLGCIELGRRVLEG